MPGIRCLAVFILVETIKNMRESLDVFLEKTPRELCVETIRAELAKLPDVTEVHHLHVWSLDGNKHYATLHAVTAASPSRVKNALREELKKLGISHATIEIEQPGEICGEKACHNYPE